VEMASPSSTSRSGELLRRIATLLFILVAGLLTVLGYYASSICMTVVLDSPGRVPPQFLGILRRPRRWQGTAGECPGFVRAKLAASGKVPARNAIPHVWAQGERRSARNWDGTWRQGQLPGVQTAKARPDYRVQSLHEGHSRQPFHPN
jgi:hypothetical protein